MDLVGKARRTAKSLFAGAVHYTGARQALVSYRRARSGSRRVLILSYHRVVPSFEEAVAHSIPGLLVSQATFRRQLEEALAGGFEPASLSQALEVISGRRRAGKDLLVVTFDDGYRDVARFAAPVLLQLGIPATCYLATGFIGTQRRFDHDRLFHLVNLATRMGGWVEGVPLEGPAAHLLSPIREGKSPSAALDSFISAHPRPQLTQAIGELEQALGQEGELSPSQGEPMTWDDARRLVRQGFSLGAHTENHAVLTLLEAEEAAAEVRSSKEAIEREVGAPVRDFAYCNGWYSRQLVGVLVAQGFRSAVTTEDVPNNPGGDPFALKRKVLWENFSRGADGRYSRALTRCHLDGVFGMLGLSQPVPGLRANDGVETASGVHHCSARS